MARRIAVLTGGGDCPGLNPAIKYIVHSAHYGPGEHFEVIGLRDGWRSLLQKDLKHTGPGRPGDFRKEEWWAILNPDDVVYWDAEGGTHLGSSRTNPFKHDNGPELVGANLEELGIEALIAIGGEDTLGVAHRLSDLGIKVVGIPKTIDKDLPGTDYTLGFETAVQIITEEVDKLRTTAGSHSRTFIIETMGRKAGHLALSGGIASGAYIILIPEHRFSVARVVRLLVERKMKGVRYSIIVIAEGAYSDKMDGPITSGRIRDTDFQHPSLGGIGELLREEIEVATDWELRSVCLSHVQRGGAPAPFDRRVGRLFGIAAVDLIRAKKYGCMVAYKNGRVTYTALEVIKNRLQLVDVESEYDTQRYNAKRSFA